MYNEELKKRFLNDKNEHSSKQFFHLFKKTSPLEYELDKDLLQFTTEDVDRLFTMIEFKTKRQKLVYNGMLATYIEWAICEEIKTDNTNPIR